MTDKLNFFEYHSWFNSFVSRLRVKKYLKFDFKFVDLEKSYISNKNPVDLYSKYFGHHNEQGYKIMSEYLASIINNKLNFNNQMGKIMNNCVQI